ncbi:MAG: vWA domain-containing protein [Planctomycetota bacterium]|jgi:hypothetical protein
MRSVFTCLALSGLAAAEPGFKEILDPFHGAWPVAGKRSQLRRAAFEQAVARRGVARAIKSFAAFEDACDAIQARLDKDHAAYLKIAQKWWGWRRQYERSYQKTHGRPPATYPIPPGLNKAFLDREKQFKTTRALKLKERLLHQWAMKRAGELLDGLDASQRAKVEAVLGNGLRHKNRHQRLRCAQLLGQLPVAPGITEALRNTQHPGVLTALVAVAPEAAAALYLEHVAWPVRAGAIRALRRSGTRRAVELLVGAHAREEGRLRDDAAGALRAVTGAKADDWQGWWSSLPADWSPPPRQPSAVDLSVSSGAFSDGKVTCFNIATSSRALVYCLEAARPTPWESVRDEVIRSVKTLPDGAKFGIVLYGDRATLWRRRLAHADAGTRADAVAFLSKHKPEGGADLLAGLTAALKLAGGDRSAPAAADTIFLGTFYGQAGGPYEDARQVALEVLPQNELRGVRIHAWGKSDGGDSFYLQTICRQFEGAHRGLR